MNQPTPTHKNKEKKIKSYFAHLLWTNPKLKEFFQEEKGRKILLSHKVQNFFVVGFLTFFPIDALRQFGKIGQNSFHEEILRLFWGA